MDISLYNKNPHNNNEEYFNKHYQLYVDYMTKRDNYTNIYNSMIEEYEKPFNPRLHNNRPTIAQIARYKGLIKRMNKKKDDERKIILSIYLNNLIDDEKRKILNIT